MTPEEIKKLSKDDVKRFKKKLEKMNELPASDSKLLKQ